MRDMQKTIVPDDTAFQQNTALPIEYDPEHGSFDEDANVAWGIIGDDGEQTLSYDEWLEVQTPEYQRLILEQRPLI